MTNKLCEHLLNHIDEGVVMVSCRDNRIVEVNAQFEEMLEFCPGELQGAQIELIRPHNAESKPQERALFAAFDGTLRWLGVRHYIGKSGRCAPFQSDVVSFEHPEFGEVHLSIERSLPQERIDSDRRDGPELQLQVERGIELAGELDSLNAEVGAYALRELAAGLAHELSQPLTAASYLCDTFHALSDRPAEQQALVESLIDQIRSQTDRAMKVVSQLRDFAGHMNPKFTVFSVDSLLQDAVELSNVLAHRKNVHIRLLTAEAFPHVIGDVRQIKLALLHLLRFAIETSHSREDVSRVVTVDARHDANWVNFCVNHDGPGMGNSMPPKIIDLLNSGSSQLCWLGLVISRSMVQAHGGRFELVSKSDQGIRVEFTLPVAGKSDDI